MHSFRIMFVAIATLYSTHAFALGHFSPMDSIYFVNAERCFSFGAPESIYGAHCHKWLDFAYETMGCIDHSEYDILKEKNLVPMCDQISGEFTHSCACGSSAPETRLLTLEIKEHEPDWPAIQDVTAQQQDLELHALPAESTRNDFRLTAQPLAKTTVGIDSMPIVEVITEDGHNLTVAEEHGVLLSDGRMVAAGDLTLDDALVTLKGSPTKILTLARRPSAGQRVYNVTIDAPSSAPLSHLMIADGLVIENFASQNSSVHEFDAITICK